jgi:hypothetical protein
MISAEGCSFVDGFWLLTLEPRKVSSLLGRLLFVGYHQPAESWSLPYSLSAQGKDRPNPGCGLGKWIQTGDEAAGVGRAILGVQG